MSGSDSYHFDLPEELIAQDPAESRGDSRLLLVEPDHGLAGEKVFRELPGLLQSGDLLVLNQSRVLPARLFTRRIDTGGNVEILLVRPDRSSPGNWWAMARPARRLRAGIGLEVLPADGSAPKVSAEREAPRLEVLDKRDDGLVLVRGSEDLAVLAESWGAIPLPPYIRRNESSEQQKQRRARDAQRYQTVFAKQDETGAGSVAAPTAGLHFSEATLEALAVAGIRTTRLTLHVGPGTFQPPSTSQMEAGRLHREMFHLPAEVLEAIAATRAAGARVIAVGTTSLRVLETVARLGLDEYDSGGVLPAGAKIDTDDALYFSENGTEPGPVFTGSAVKRNGFWEVDGCTRLFIRPPERVIAADGLLTNFHLPGSSLLMLVASLMGDSIWSDVYRHAVAEQMRFYSYGDCMLILPKKEGPEE